MPNVLSTNPATGETRALPLRDSTLAEVRAACLRAAGAARELASRPLTFRASLLLAVAEELAADGERIVSLADEETALGRPRLDGELRRTAYQLRFFAGVVSEGSFLGATIDHAGPSPMGPLPDLRRMNVPLGPVAVFGASNFPLAFSVAGGDTASALAAGCPVVVKAHPAHPATSLACFEAIERGARRTSAPDGTAALVFGLEAGGALVDDPAVAAVGFTGSAAAGTALWRRANARPFPIPFYGELGSANPLVVTAEAARERGAAIGAAVAASVTFGAGQLCTKPGLLFVPLGSGGDLLVAALREALEATPGLTMLTSAIADGFRRRRAEVEASAGVAALVPSAETSGTAMRASLLSTTAAVFAAEAGAALGEECFGPLALVVRYEGREDLDSALDATAPSLAFSLFLGEDDPEGARLLEAARSKAGRVIVNAPPTGVGVSWSQQHGGPWPATTAPWATSVGAAAVARWLRPVAFQGVPAGLLPPPLSDDNPWRVPQRVDGTLRRPPTGA